MPADGHAIQSPRQPSWPCILSVSLIIGLAAFLRLQNLASSSFTYDAAALSSLANQFVQTGIPPLHGMVSSVGLNNPPLSVYLFSLPMLFSRSPIALQAFVALFNTLAVFGCFYLGYRYWNATVGLVAALLFAVSPWAVHHGRRILGQDLMGAGVVLYFVFLYAWFVDGRRWALTGALVTLAALTQIHFAALALAPLLALLLLVEFVRRLRRHDARLLLVPLLTGLGIGILLYLPYLAGEARDGWASMRVLRETGSATTQWRPEAIRHVLLNIGGRNIHSLAGAERFEEYLDSIVDLRYWPDRIEEALAALAIAYLAVKLWINRRDVRALRRDGLLLLWIVTPILVFLRWPSEVPPHYLTPVFPAPYLALAATGSDLATAIGRRVPRPRWVAGVGAMALLALAAWQAYLSTSIYRFVDLHDTPGGWGTPVRILLEAAGAVERYAQPPNQREVLILCPGSEPRWDECPAVFEYLTAGLPDVSFMDFDDPLIWSRQEDADTIILLAPGDSRARAELPNLADALPGESVPLREEVDEYRIYRIHDNFGDAADILEGSAGPDDAIVLAVADGSERFRAGYDGGAPIYELPGEPTAEAQVITRLEEVLRQRGRIFAVYFKADERDPEGTVSSWLDSHAYKSDETWVGALQIASYISPAAVASWPMLATEADFGAVVTLEEVALPGRSVAAGDLLPVRLTFSAGQEAGADYALSLQLLNQQGSVVAQRDAPLLNPSGLPTGGWADGERVTVAPGAMIPIGTAPGEYPLTLVVYDPQTGARLPVNGTNSLALGTVQVRRPEATPQSVPGIPYPQEYAFGEVKLLGHGLQMGRENILELALWWRAESPPTTNWTFEVQLLDEAGRTTAEMRAPLHGDYPATDWQAGEIVRSRHQMPLPEGLAAGRYRLQLELLDPISGKSAGHADLGPVVVE